MMFTKELGQGLKSLDVSLKQEDINNPHNS
jgi:hypothetical protein